MEKRATISWNELKTLRITCKACGTVFEADLGKVDSKLIDGTSCPVCQNSFLLPLGDGNHENMLKRLVYVSRGLAKLQDRLEIEFTIPVDE